MMNDFDELEDIFADIGIEKGISSAPINLNDDGFDMPKKATPKLNKELVDYYSLNPGLLEGDIESGIIPMEFANELRSAIYAYPEIEKENPPLIGEGNTESKDKVKVKSSKAGKILHESYDLGFAEPLLLGLVVSSIGFVYLCYLYLVI